MADLRIYGEQETLALAVTYLQQLYPGKATHPRSYLGGHARALAQLVAAIQVAISDANRDGIPAVEVVEGALQSRCSTGRLDEWAQVFGLPSNRGVGVFGRNGPQVATGGAGAVTGAVGVAVAAGALLSDLSGQIQVELVTGLLIPVNGTVDGLFQATVPGAAGNLPVGTKLRWLAPPAGLAATVTLTTALTGGYEIESDLDLILRLLRRLQDPPKGGTAVDFRTWAEAATDPQGRSLGITRAHVFPKRDGILSVDVLALIGGSGKARDPGAQRAAQLQVFLDGKRVVCDTVRVLRPYFDADGIRVRIRGVAQPAYAFDWDESSPAALGLGLPIVTATNTSITVATSSIPARLTSALLGGQPRVQVSLPSASPLPVQRRVVNLAQAGFNTSFILDSALPAVPQVGDRVWPGGGCVEPVALACLTYVDNVGPSKQSGFADTVTDAWEGKITIGRLAQAALGARAADGGLVLVYSPKVGQGVGVNVATGLGAFSGLDYALYDNQVGGLSPQVAWVYSIIVVPGEP